MKGDILFITAQNIETDGRTQALINVIKSFGKVNVIGWSQGKKTNLKDCSQVSYHIIEEVSYKKWCKAAALLGKKLGASVLFVDNRRATIVGLKIKKALKPSITIYDARELYLPKETTGFTGKIGCHFEKKMIAGSDLVICANDQRKVIMEQEFSCGGPVIVFDNFRKLQYSEDFSKEEMDAKYGKMFVPGLFNIISTAGAEIDRGSLKLIEAQSKLQFPSQLIFVGCKDDEDLKTAKELVQKLGVNNVQFLPRVSLDEIKYLIGKSHIGVAMYHKRNSNNLYCSSGKIYEFLYEGLPIATSDNPTMACVTEKYKVGVSSDNIEEAIREIHDKYPEFVESTLKMVQLQVVENAQMEFKNQLSKFMSSEHGRR